MNSTSYYTSLSSNSSGFEDLESVCDFRSQVLSIVVFTAIAIVPPSLTLIIILIHKKLRKQHNIIPFNIILCDFFVVALSAYLLAADSGGSASAVRKWTLIINAFSKDTCYVYTCIYTYIYIYLYIYAHYTHMYIHTHTHIFLFNVVFFFIPNDTNQS